MGHVVYPTQTKVNPLNQDTVDRQTWDLPCVDKHTKVSQESINPATTTLNNTINESWVQNCDVPTIANRQFLSWGRSLDHKERKSPTHILEKNGLLSNFGCATLLSPGWWILATYIQTYGGHLIGPSPPGGGNNHYPILLSYTATPRRISFVSTE